MSLFTILLEGVLSYSPPVRKSAFKSFDHFLIQPPFVAALNTGDKHVPGNTVDRYDARKTRAMSRLILNLQFGSYLSVRHLYANLASK